LGSGPHVLQPIERVPSERGEALVAYSLGNLASGMGRAYRLGETPDSFIHPANVRPEARDGVVLRLTLRRAEGRLEITGECRLLFTENDWLLQRNAAPPHVLVRPLSEIPIAFCEDRLPPMRRALGSTLPLVPDSCSR
jgi:Bacterial capsule synthesis protein PGA_cap